MVYSTLDYRTYIVRPKLAGFRPTGSSFVGIGFSDFSIDTNIILRNHIFANPIEYSNFA